MSLEILKLGPGNPILLRVVTAGGRRLRHAFTRWGYLGILIVALMFMLLLTRMSVGTASLSDLAKASAQIFTVISYIQLGMICLLAPVFCAAAITQERDSQTYNILLVTPLTNTQIVLGSLFSRLYYVVALLLSGAPVFTITLLYGGVTPGSIILSFAIALTTAFFTGSLAIAIAVFRLGSGKTVFWFYVFNAIYLVGVYLLDLYLRTLGGGVHTTLLTGMHPFLALESVVIPTAYPTPDVTKLTDMFAPFRYYLIHPAYSYVAITGFASLALVIPSAIVLRRIAQRSEAGLWSFLRNIIMRGKEARSRRARTVWNNPVAWREAATRAGFSGRGLTRWLTILFGLACGMVVIYMYHSAILTLEQTRQFLLGLIMVEFSVSLMVATNTSASAVTRERESQTLDLLLVTPITSRYYIWGKLRGLVQFMIPFVAVPAATVLLVILYDCIAGMHVAAGTESLTALNATQPAVGFWPRFMAREWVVWPETLITLPLILTVILAWTCMLGLQLSLKWSRTLVAVMGSLGVLAGICSVLGVCGFTAAWSLSWFGLIVSGFSPFTAVCVLLDPQDFAPSSFSTVSGALGTFAPGKSDGYPEWIGRTMIFGSVVGASIAYCLLVWTMYRSMVKNFDMIIRRQHQ